MGFYLRPVVAVFALALTFSIPSFAAAIDETIPDSMGLAQLEQRALQAKPKEQIFLYTELVHTMTELAGKQMLDGDTANASVTLSKVERYAVMIHVSLAADAKRLKNAELLMHHTTRKLAEYLHLCSGDDRATLQATLKHLDQLQNEMLTQVFNH